MYTSATLERMAQLFRGLAIFSVDPGSAAERAGIRAGDVVLRLNGQRVECLHDYGAARQLRPELDDLVVVRRGREVRLPVCDPTAN